MEIRVSAAHERDHLAVLLVVEFCEIADKCVVEITEGVPTRLESDALELEGLSTVCHYLVLSSTVSNKQQLLGADAEMAARVNEWIYLFLSNRSSSGDNHLMKLNAHLENRMYVGGECLTLADLILLAELYPVASSIPSAQYKQFCHVLRWHDFIGSMIQCTLTVPPIKRKLPLFDFNPPVKTQVSKLIRKEEKQRCKSAEKTKHLDPIQVLHAKEVMDGTPGSSNHISKAAKEEKKAAKEEKKAAKEEKKAAKEEKKAAKEEEKAAKEEKKAAKEEEKAAKEEKKAAKEEEKSAKEEKKASKEEEKAAKEEKKAAKEEEKAAKEEEKAAKEEKKAAKEEEKAAKEEKKAAKEEEKAAKEEKKAAKEEEKAAKEEKKAAKEEKKAAKEEKKKAKNKGEARIDQLDLRIGRIVSVKPHPDADSLYIEEIDLGEDNPRQIISGLVKYVSQEAMENRFVVVCCNLKPATMRGVKSYGMVMCASDASHEKVDPLIPPEGVVIGEKVAFEGYEEDPIEEIKPKQKLLEALFPHLITDLEGLAKYKDVVFMSSKGPIKSSIPNGHIS